MYHPLGAVNTVSKCNAFTKALACDRHTAISAVVSLLVGICGFTATAAIACAEIMVSAALNATNSSARDGGNATLGADQTLAQYICDNSHIDSTGIDAFGITSWFTGLILVSMGVIYYKQVRTREEYEKQLVAYPNQTPEVRCLDSSSGHLSSQQQFVGSEHGQILPSATNTASVHDSTYSPESSVVSAPNRGRQAPQHKTSVVAAVGGAGSVTNVVVKPEVPHLCLVEGGAPNGSDIAMKAIEYVLFVVAISGATLMTFCATDEPDLVQTDTKFQVFCATYSAQLWNSFTLIPGITLGAGTLYVYTKFRQFARHVYATYQELVGDAVQAIITARTNRYTTV